MATVLAQLDQPRTLAELVKMTEYSARLILASLWEARVKGIDVVAVRHPNGEPTTFELQKES